MAAWSVWAAGGLTLQLNREDTFPGRLSPGQVVFPGLQRLDSAPDYAGRLNLYNGEFTASGNGITAMLYVEPATDVAVLDVKGVNPSTPQIVLLRLWSPRRPTLAMNGTTAALSETWTDSGVPGASGKTFGSLAAVRVDGRNAHWEKENPLVARLSFLPNSNGAYRVLIAAPHWNGGNALAEADTQFVQTEKASPLAHRAWWNNFWKRAALLQLASRDGTAEYLENLRAIYLFTAAAEKGNPYPGSQAGIADLFSSAADHHQWDSSAFWHWNLRMQVAANLSSGLFEENAPYFRLYRENLPNIERWTRDRMRGIPGSCVPETMRFNGQGIEYETWLHEPGFNCDMGSKPYYNARTLSTGAEVSFWIWQQYLATDDRAFLDANYPVMASAARFLLAYSKLGRDGKRHTSPSNAHENQWDVKDPITDLCAMRTLFPELIEASRILGLDADLARQARLALSQLPDFPRTDSATLKKQLTAADDATGNDVLAQSWQQDAPVHNTENLGLEPVWPYGLISDDGPFHALALRTFEARPNKMQNDWSYDPLQAARLGQADEMRHTLVELTKKYQWFPSGLAHFVGPEFYVEQIGVLTAALNESLAQDYDGVIRIAPAWPRDWDAEGSVFVQHRGKVAIEIRNGIIGPVTFSAGAAETVRIRNPWPGRPVSVIESGHSVKPNVADNIISFPVAPGKHYLLSPQGIPPAAQTASTTNANSGPRHLGQRWIGLSRASQD
jgi:alpha-L-fucosidase 2